MNITEALKKNYKKIHWQKCTCYLEVDNEQFYPEVRWRKKLDGQLHDNQSFTVNQLTRTDWQPYEPEPKFEKCEACKEIEEIKKKYGPLLTREDHKFVCHLHKYHCECDKETP